MSSNPLMYGTMMSSKTREKGGLLLIFSSACLPSGILLTFVTFTLKQVFKNVSRYLIILDQQDGRFLDGLIIALFIHL